MAKTRTHSLDRGFWPWQKKTRTHSLAEMCDPNEESGLVAITNTLDDDDDEPGARQNEWDGVFAWGVGLVLLGRVLAEKPTSNLGDGRGGGGTGNSKSPGKTKKQIQPEVHKTYEKSSETTKDTTFSATIG